MNDFMIDVGCATGFFAMVVANGKCGLWQSLCVRWQFTFMAMVLTWVSALAGATCLF